ncbi:TetR family transcriptional regulator [Pacificimonas flava]|uniref:TetR family transcriptional regulator n=2 Tax=Pacificimonas TaxID=1960290 RepID=A0A219B3U4_9SPHN|nr:MULTISPECIES: TetR family transcriptional regulator [Pacificimonas]MBZ6377228.1 TetR family transcriptional regulator [Pacificimonas aurantium]OWV33052.1 TetR family transcriptional regulator [Pacificimonas flava]
MSIRARLTPEESRAAALAAARELLLESGPTAVTLKAVAGRVGRTHQNLLHHFGSAAGLQTALAEYLAERACARIGKAMQERRAGLASARDIVDLTFDAFGREGGGGALASWIMMTGNEAAFEPVVEAIRALVEGVEERAELEPGVVEDTVLQLVLMALGDAMIGHALAPSLGRPRLRGRDLAERMVEAVFVDGAEEEE